MGRSNRLCIMFDAHRQAGSEILARSYARITELFGRFGDIVAVFDGAQPPDGHFGRTIELSKSDIFHSFPHAKGDFIIPGNVDLKFLAAVMALGDYDCFIRIEFDVWPSSSAEEQVAELCDIARSGAFGASYIRDGLHDKGWVYWPSLCGPGGEPVDIRERRAAFLPLATFPRTFIDYYMERLHEGWTGHYEALMPTLARRAGLPLAELGEAGRGFTSSKEFNVKIQSFTHPTQGSFVHPVKSVAQIAGIEAPYLDDIVATGAEIQELRTRFEASNVYLEYGAGGTTALACHCGIQQITSVETDVNFCNDLIRKHALRKFIDTGRLNIRHVFVGRTGKWGYPVDPPSDRQIENYLAWPKHVPSADLVLIDGRFRVAVAAEAALSCAPDTVIMIHDYSMRPQYKIVEGFLEPIKLVDSLAVFRPRADKRDVAAQVRKDYLRKMD